MTIDEIRQGFLMSSTARERARRFRKERVDRILNGEVPRNLPLSPKLVFHAIPLTANDGSWVRFREEESAVQGASPHPCLGLGMIGGYVDNWHYNTDGFLAFKTSANSYVQIFRDFGIEALDTAILSFRRLPERFGDIEVTFGINIDRGILGFFRRCQEFWSRIGVSGPVVMYLTLTGVKGRGIVTSNIFHRDVIAIDRDCVMTSDVVIEDRETREDQTVKPLLDFVWNAGGYPESPYFHDGFWREG